MLSELNKETAKSINDESTNFKISGTGAFIKLLNMKYQVSVSFVMLRIISLAIFELSSRMILSSALPKLSRLMLPYQTIFSSITANF